MKEWIRELLNSKLMIKTKNQKDEKISRLFLCHKKPFLQKNILLTKGDKTPLTCKSKCKPKMNKKMNASVKNVSLKNEQNAKNVRQ